MASPRLRLAANAGGDFFVDSSCIDCEACRWIAPETFDASGGQSRVHHQPTDRPAVDRALLALVACPTASIGTMGDHDVKAARDRFPIAFADEVHHCGYHAESSFGATSWLIVRPEGNVLVDSPRFAKPLVKQIEALGGVKKLFLTHKDDIADQQKFRDHFGCEVIIHARDRPPSLCDVQLVEGEEATVIDDTLTVIPVPGHTAGSACLLYKNRYLFTGDHLAYDPDYGHLYAFRSACWYDWKTQIRSMERLRAFRFEWVLPGHGHPHHHDSASMPGELERCIAWMKVTRIESAR